MTTSHAAAIAAEISADAHRGKPASSAIRDVIPASGLRKIGHFAGGILTTPFDVIPGGVPYTATLETRFERYEGSLGIEAWIPLSPVSGLIARVAVFGGGEVYDYDFRLTDPPLGGGSLFEGFVKERVTTASKLNFGFGLRAAIPLSF